MRHANSLKLTGTEKDNVSRLNLLKENRNKWACQ